MLHSPSFIHEGTNREGHEKRRVSCPTHWWIYNWLIKRLFTAERTSCSSLPNTEEFTHVPGWSLVVPPAAWPTQDLLFSPQVTYFGGKGFQRGLHVAKTQPGVSRVSHKGTFFIPRGRSASPTFSSPKENPLRQHCNFSKSLRIDTLELAVNAIAEGFTLLFKRNFY